MLAIIRWVQFRLYAMALLGGLVVMIFSAVNGYALFFNDSRSYVRGPALAINATTHVDLIKDWPSRTQEGEATGNDSTKQTVKTIAARGSRLGTGFTANRSIYYGVVAFTGYILSDFWLGILFQALLVSLPIAFLVIRGMSLNPRIYIFVLLGLAILTPMGVFAALVMPDILAPALIISLAVLFAYSDRLLMLDRVILIAIMALATLSHASHIVILAALVPAMLLLAWLRRSVSSYMPAISAAIVGVMIGIAGQVAFSKALEHATGQKPLLLPHITAHLVDMGPGYRYLRDNCPRAGFAVCQYLDRLPMYWEDFIGADPKRGVFAVADLPTKRRLSDEQIRFGFAVFHYDPVGVTAGLTKDFLYQIARFRLNDLQVTPTARANYKASLPSRVSSQIFQSAVGRTPLLLDALTVTTYTTVITSVALIFWLLVRWKRATHNPEISRFLDACHVAIAGVLINAVVCSTLASPYDRFESRVIWLLPLFAWLGLILDKVISSRQIVSQRLS